MLIVQNPGGNATLPDALSAHVDKAIRNGLPNEQDRIESRMRSLAYFNLDGARYIPRRDAESFADYQNRPHRHLPFTRRVVEILCSHLYQPGPSRSFKDKALGEWFDAVAADNMLNCLWQRANKLATLHGLCAFQVAGKGNDSGDASSRPLKIHLWDYSQFVFYADPDDSSRMAHMVTIDRADFSTRYTWYSDEFIRTYKTRKHDYSQTNCGRSASLVSEIENPYRRVPFSLVHNDLPTGGLDTTGLGDYLAEINGTIDVEASDMAQAVAAYHTPMGVLYDGTIATNIVKKPGHLVRINSDPSSLDHAPSPRIEYPQPNLDIEGGWSNIRSAIATVLEGIGVPESAYRLDQATLPSGVAQVAEQMPLIAYSHARQEPFRKYETDLVRLAAGVAGGYAHAPRPFGASSAGSPAPPGPRRAGGGGGARGGGRGCGRG